MPSDKLTELGVRKAKPSSKQKKLTDGRGLFLLLHPNGKTCGAYSFWATGLAVYGTYLLDGSKLFWAVSSSAYPSSVDVGDNETFTKQ